MLLLVALSATLFVAIAAGDGDGATLGFPDAPPPEEASTLAGMAPSPSVSVTTDRSGYQPGERIVVTISNGLSVPVHAPPRGGCSIVTVLRLEDGQWLRVGSCPTLNVTATVIPAMGDLTRVLGPASQAPSPQGPIVIGPVPAATVGSAAQLPTAVPWRPGDPVREIPEGAVAAPFSVTDGDLPPGTYRIEFSFGSGSAPDEIQTVYSEPFVVAG